MSETYNRRDFISKIFGATVMSMAAPVVLGELVPSLQAKAGTLSGIYTIKLSDYPTLSKDGGIVWVKVANMPAPNAGKKVIVYRKSATEYFAYSERCTHQSCSCAETNYNASTMTHSCPCHGSQFNAEGKVTKGPASSNLDAFTTTLGNNSGSLNIEIPNLVGGVYDQPEGANYVSQVFVGGNSVSVECRFSQACRAELMVLSVEGREISKIEINYTEPNQTKRVTMDKPSASGVYLLGIKTTNAIEDVRKFVV